MPTLQEIKSYIASLPAFPVNRDKNVFYGNTDATSRPLVLFSDLDQTYERDSCEVATTESTFNVHVFTDGTSGTLAQAENLSEQINAFLDDQKVTTKTRGCFCTRYQVITEPTYVYHVVRSYKLMESN